MKRLAEEQAAAREENKVEGKNEKEKDNQVPKEDNNEGTNKNNMDEEGEEDRDIPPSSGSKIDIMNEWRNFMDILIVSLEDLGKGVLTLIKEFQSESAGSAMMKCLVFTFSLLSILKYLFKPNDEDCDATQQG